MLDENLPTFHVFLKPTGNEVAHQRSVFLSHHGSEPAPAYTLQYIDPASSSPLHKNCYAAGLYDAYNPDVLYGEVLARPGWTQPTLSQEEIKRNGGVAPPPQPVLPSDFTIQLYNPDQQVRVDLKEGKWGASDHYEFSMPINTFRTPSASNLDRGQSDPASLATTPKVHFAWRKESKLGRDLTCFMTGKSTDPVEKKSSRRDPDIAIALWRSMRELTVYEPNLSRLDMEDPKGLEIVLLLSAIIIRDLFFNGKDRMRETFNIADLPFERKLSGGGRKLSNPQQTHSIVGPPNPLASHPVSSETYAAINDNRRNQLPKLQTTPPQAKPSQQPPPMPDPRAQWALEAETARLRAQAEAEARKEERRRKERERADEAEARRLQKQIEEEERQRQKKQAEVDKETERLRKKYGVQPLPSEQRPPQANHSRASSHLAPPPLPPNRPRPSLGSNGLYVQPPASASSSAIVMSGANPSATHLVVDGGAAGHAKHKKSFFGLRGASDEDANKLRKKASAMW